MTPPRRRTPSPPASDQRARPLAASRRAAIWFGLMAVAGFGFGLVSERRPFGDDVFARPFVLFFILVGLGLLVLRVATGRPVPELLPERVLVIGCFAGVLAFLAGNFIAVRVLLLPLH